MDERIGLNRHIGSITGISLVMGSMIGSGIFVSAKGVLAGVGSVGATLILYIVCGLHAFIGCLMYIELGCIMPKAGGDYEYILQSFGAFTAFLFVWVMVFMIIPASNAVAGLTFSDYMLQPFFPCNEIPISSRTSLAILVIMTITFINCLNQKLVSGVQNISTLVKILALMAISCAGIYAMALGHTDNFKNPFEIRVPEGQQSNVMEAIHSVLFAYSGWNFLNFVAEEVRKPPKNLKISVLTGVSFTTVLTVFVNTAYFTLLSPIEIIESNAVGVSFGNKFSTSFGDTIAVVVPLSVIGFINGIIFATSRVSFSAARNSHMPFCMGLLNVHNRLPICAVSITGIVSIIFVCFTNSLHLMTICSFAWNLFICISVIGLLILRYRHPEWNRPFKAPISLAIFFTITTIIVTILTFVLLPSDANFTMIFIMAGSVLYFVFIQNEEIGEMFSKKLRNFNVICQKATVSVFDESTFSAEQLRAMQLYNSNGNAVDNEEDDDGGHEHGA